MIYHASIPANDPPRVAGVLAELWNGHVLPFAPWPDAFIVMVDDERRSAIEVHPRTLPMTPGSGEEMVQVGRSEASLAHSGFHLAVATPLSAEQVMALGRREGWRTIRCSRGGLFEVVELWIENTTMIEALTEEMQADYVDSMTIRNWTAMLEQGPPQAAA